MIKKFKRFAQKINENNRKIIHLESQNAELERFVKENYWANVFNSAIRGNEWFENVSLNVGRWAGSYSLFYVLFRILNEIKPSNILELGLGESTKMIQAYKQFHNQGANCITIEQNQEWIDFRLQNDISTEFISIWLMEVFQLSVHATETLAYKGLPEKLKECNLKFNLILIDGPWGSAKYSRYNVVELIERDLLSDDFIIIMDDFNRQGEKQTVEIIRQKFENTGKPSVFAVYKGEKEVAVLASGQYKYLESL